MSASRLPAVVFLGHGTPMNALRSNQWTAGWERLGNELPRPKAILVISAHWLTHGMGVTAMAHPRTIHDFGGAYQALFDIRYPAPGDPALAARICDLLAPMPIVLDQEWGLDHGSWSVLLKAYPHADIPVLQLSVDMSKPPSFHYAVGEALRPLRDEGVLILGTGNVVHNHAAVRRDAPVGYDWAIRFNDYIRDALVNHQHDRIVDYLGFGRDAELSVPTPDHYYPLLYVAAAGGDDPVTVELDGVDSASMSMLSVRIGGSQHVAGGWRLTARPPTLGAGR